MESYNLRRERIRQQNEQLEQRHKEIEADKLLAKSPVKFNVNKLEDMMPAERLEYIDRKKGVVQKVENFGNPSKENIKVCVTFNKPPLALPEPARPRGRGIARRETSNIQGPVTRSIFFDDDDDDDDEDIFKDVNPLSPFRLAQLRQKNPEGNMNKSVDELSDMAEGLSFTRPGDADLDHVLEPASLIFAPVLEPASYAPRVMPNNQALPPYSPPTPSSPVEVLEFLPDMDLSKPPPPLGFKPGPPNVQPYKPLNYTFSSPLDQRYGNSVEPYCVDSPDQGHVGGLPFLPPQWHQSSDPSALLEMGMSQTQPPQIGMGVPQLVETPHDSYSYQLQNQEPVPKAMRPLLGRSDGDQTPVQNMKKLDSGNRVESGSTDRRNNWEHCSDDTLSTTSEVPSSTWYQSSDLSDNSGVDAWSASSYTVPKQEKITDWTLMLDDNDFFNTGTVPQANRSNTSDYCSRTSGDDAESKRWEAEDAVSVASENSGQSQQWRSEQSDSWNEDIVEPQPLRLNKQVAPKRTNKSALQARMEAARNDSSKRFSRAHLMDKMKPSVWDLTYKGQTITISNDGSAEDHLRALTAGNRGELK